MGDIVKFKRSRKSSRKRAEGNFIKIPYQLKVAFTILSLSGIVLFGNLVFHTNILAEFFFTTFWIYVFYLAYNHLREPSSANSRTKKLDRY